MTGEGSILLEVQRMKDPEKRRRNNREAQRRYRARQAKKLTQTPISSPLPPAPIEIKTAEDLRSILAEQINLVRTAPTGDVFTRGRLCGYLCGVALRNLEVSEIEVRLKELEERINEQGTVGQTLGISLEDQET